MREPNFRGQVSEFIDELTTNNPTMSADILTASVKAVVNLEKSWSGLKLLDKLSVISKEDAERVNRLLDTIARLARINGVSTTSIGRQV